MSEPLMAGWENFYVITGSAASALTGLTFVVIALAAQISGVRPSGLRGFVTPTVVHFSSVLALACLVSMPHLSAPPLAAVIGVGGLAGLMYAAWIAKNLGLHSELYRPVFEDWTWHVILPAIAYTGLLVAAMLLAHRHAFSLYSLAVASLFLLLIGIHNAWDIAVWLSTNRNPAANQAAGPPGKDDGGTPA